MHNQYIDGLINYKLKQLKLILEPGDWYHLEKKFSEAFSTHISEKLSNYQVDSTHSDWPALNELLNEAFDLQIKQVLSEHQLSLNPSDWSILAASLDDQPFDHHIAKQLNDLDLPLEANDWKLFAADLDEHPIDTVVREQFEELELQVDSNAWELFESKIEASFDTQIKHKLDNITLRASSEDWSAMMALLDGDSFITDIREALDNVEFQGSQTDWQAMEDKLNQPLYTAFQEKFAFHAIPPLKGDWKAMEALLKEDEDPAPIFLPWYTRSRVYLTAASVLLLLILSPFWSGKDNILKNRIKEFANQYRIEDSVNNTEQKELIEEVIASATPATSTPTKETGTETEGLIKSVFPTDLLSSGAEAVINSAQVSFSKPQPLDAQAAVEFTQPLDLKDKGVLINTTAALSKASDKKSNPKINADGVEREGFLRSIPFHAFANPWMMSPKVHSKGINKVSIFRRKRSPVRLGLYMGSSKTSVELSSPKASVKKKFGETFVGGVRAEFTVKRNVSFVTGFNYEKRQLEHSYQFFPARPVQPRLITSSPNPVNQFISANIQMLELPLLFRFYGESKSNLTGYGQIGLVPMISLTEKYQFWDDTNLPPFQVPTSENLPDSESQKQDWSFNTYAGNVHAALGLEYRFNHTFSLAFEPYGILSLQRTKGIGSFNLRKKMYTGGLSFSLMYGLSRK